MGDGALHLISICARCRKPNNIGYSASAPFAKGPSIELLRPFGADTTSGRKSSVVRDSICRRAPNDTQRRWSHGCRKKNQP